ncbi:autophagy-related protein 22-like protein [Mycotypha africana]|uniref:autophagy-related protein 22-like protein n=1 Tax=Mycotypha africana TaxID=64632 RepID=UPI002300D01F|nr:autophagy-related protein 22-like protein [Mycotypha africana]KAI8991723.1 autophagy-related protein 22-like protein [Mycotypha africana]
MPIILQYLAYKNGFNPLTPEVKGCNMVDTSQPCHIPWGSGTKPVQSMLLYVQAIAFSIQFLLFTTFSSLADYEQWNKYILLGSTLIGCLTQALPILLWINPDNENNWRTMMGIMILALISYGSSLVFYAAAFPNLSDNLPIVRRARVDPNITEEKRQEFIERWRNHVSAISTTFSNIGFLLMSGILSCVAFAPYGNNDTIGNQPIYNVIATVACAAYWAVNAIPYFVLTPRGRKGPPLPPKANYLTFGWKSIVVALREIRKLRYLFIYLVAYFMFSDAVSTIGQMLTIIQGELTQFSAQQNALFGFVQSVTSILGCLIFLWVSKIFKIRTKTSLLIIIGTTALIPLWGCFGIYFPTFGIHSLAELWLLSVWQGLFTAPIWAWQQTMLAELIPKGKENLFFGLFGIVNKASSWIGPVVIGAITDATSNIWKGWPFVFMLFLIAIILIVSIDVDKAKVELMNYAKAETDVADEKEQ